MWQGVRPGDQKLQGTLAISHRVDVCLDGAELDSGRGAAYYFTLNYLEVGIPSTPKMTRASSK